MMTELNTLGMARIAGVYLLDLFNDRTENIEYDHWIRILEVYSLELFDNRGFAYNTVLNCPAWVGKGLR